MTSNTGCTANEATALLSRVEPGRGRGAGEDPAQWPADGHEQGPQRATKRSARIGSNERCGNIDGSMRLAIAVVVALVTWPAHAQLLQNMGPPQHRLVHRQIVVL